MRAHTEAPVEGPLAHSYILYISTPHLPLPQTDLHQTPYYRDVEGWSAPLRREVVVVRDVRLVTVKQTTGMVQLSTV